MANVLGVTPTKGSLMAIQKSLSLSTLGFELLDRKRNILIREMMPSIRAYSSDVTVLLVRSSNSCCVIISVI